MSEFLNLSQQGDIARLKLNRPLARNALTWEMWRAFPPLLAEVAGRDSVKLLLLEGCDGCFAAGADIAEIAALADDRDQAMRYAADMAAALDGLAAFDKPTIAMIAGPCVGGGLAIALACDLRFAAIGSRLGVTPAKLGLVYPLSDTARLIEVVGLSAAKGLLFTGRLLQGAEALDIALIDRLVPDAQLEQETLDYAGQICAASQFSVRAAKRTMRRILTGQWQDTPETLAEFPDAVAGPDFAEGYRAFREKRPARFPWS